MHLNMGMKKDNSTSEVCHADNGDCGSLPSRNVVCDKPHLSASQSDNSARMNDVAACSSGSSENNMGYGASNNASKDVETLLESNNEEVSAMAAKSREMNCLPSCTELEKKKPHSSASVNRNDQEKVEGIIAEAPSCSLDVRVDAALDAAEPLPDTKVIVVGSNSRASAKGQTGENDIYGQQLNDCLSSRDPDEKAHQYNAPDQFVEVKKHALNSSLDSEGDDADLEEQDVKVCDICGDAGREDLLAICSRCSDGAEHTYCMREMLDEVPEGNWLCEECKSCEEMERKRQEYAEILGARERSKRNFDFILEKKEPSVSGNRADSGSLTKRLTNKRRGGDIEVDPAAKKQVLESMIQSPTTSSPARDGSLSRDNSLKNIDKTNAKLTHQTSISGRDNLEKPRSPNANLSNAKGSYLKSNSFGSYSSIPKVKMGVEIPQKHKQSVDAKDASTKILSKSMPFKGSLSRSNTTESKVKMLSPKDSHILETRGLKQAKDRVFFERKNSIKLDHPSASQLAVNGCKNQLRGEVRRHQSSCHNGGGSSSTNGASVSADAKSSLSLKEGCTSSLSQLDGVSSEKNLDRSSNHSRQCVGDGALQSSASETSAVRSLKDGVNEENKLKAAIQAAMQKRLDMCKRSKGSDKSNVVSVSNVNSVSERTTSDRPNNSRNSVSAERIHEAEAASPSCSLNCVNQSKVLSAVSVDSFRARNMVSVSSYVEQRSAIPEHNLAWIGSFEVYRGGSTPEQICGIQAHLSTCASYKVLEMVKKFPQKVPLSEVPRSCTWPVQFQDSGAEEDNIAIYFFAKDVESYERSYKNLLEKLMKDDLALKGNIDGIDLLIFPSKQLTKRCQRWNMLFFIWGVFRGRKENCLDIKSGHAEKLDLSSMNTCKAVTSDFTSPPEKPSLDGYLRQNISMTKSDLDVRGHNAFHSGFVIAKESPKFSNGDRCLREHSPHDTNTFEMKKSGHHENKTESKSAFYHPEQVEHGDADFVKVAECQTSSSLSGGGGSYVKDEKISGDQTPAQATFGGSSSENKTVTSVKDEGSGVKIKETGKDSECRMKLADSPKKENTPVDAVNDQGQIKLEDNSRQGEQCGEKENYRAKVILEGELKQEEADLQKSGGSSSLAGDVKVKDVIDQQQSFQRERPEEDCSSSFDSPTTVASQKRPLNDMNVACDGGDEESANERAGSSSIPFCSPHTTLTHDIHGPSTALEKKHKPVSGKETPAESVSVETERFFFPVDKHPSAGIKLRVASASSGNDHDDLLVDGFPNLELALGVENRRSKSGFFLGLVNDHRGQPNSPSVGRRKEDEESSAALSLSLAFPFGDKERSRAGEGEFSEREPGK